MKKYILTLCLMLSSSFAFAAEITQTAANVVVVTAGTILRDNNAGATITAGMPVYLDTSNPKVWLPARANAVATAKCGGIALNSASTGQPLSVMIGGVINPGAGTTLVVGTFYAVSDLTAGKILPDTDYNSGDYPVIVGVAITTANLRISVIEAGVVKP